MTSPFSKIYPNVGERVITMDGGLNSKFPRALINDNESPDCLNVVFGGGSVETRDGISKVNTASVGSYTIDGLYTRKANDGSETMVVFAGGTAYDLQGTSFITIGSAQSVFTAGTRVGAALYENHLFCGNNNAIPYKYDGDFTRHGVYPPATTHTASTSSNGTLTGDYQYKITFVNSQVVEGDVGPINATFTAAGEEILVSSIPVAPQSWGVDARNVYRTEAGGTTFKLAGQISNNTATTFTDNSSDSELGTDAPTDNGVPPVYGIVTYHQDRLFMNDPGTLNYLWYTELGNPYVVKVTNFRKIGDNTSDLVRGIVSYNNSIIVTGDKSITMIYMPSTDDTTWLTVVMKIPYGSKSPFSLIPFNDRLIFPAVQNGEFVGIGSIIGNALEPDATFLTALTAGSELQSTKIEDQMFQVQTAYISNISGIAHKNKLYITMTYGTGQTENNRIYVMNYEKDNLSKVQKFSWAPWSGLNASQFTIYNGDLYMGSSTDDGFVHKMLDGTYNDNGAAIDSYIWTKEFAGFKGDENFNKDFRFIDFLVEKSGAWFMDIFVRSDSDKGSGNKLQYNLNPGSNLWGFLMLGTDNWGGGQDEEDVSLSIGTLRGKRLQIKFTNQNTVDQKFKINWLKYTYNKKGYR